MTQNFRTNDEAVTGSKCFFFIFTTFLRDTTILRGALVENVKKSKINPPYYTGQGGNAGVASKIFPSRNRIKLTLSATQLLVEAAGELVLRLP
jgi:hypothetical protein